MFDGLKFFDDYGIDYYSHGKNISSGWLGLNCPKCSDVSQHLGFNPESGAFVCWRCGKMSVKEAIKDLTGKTWPEVYRIFEKYAKGTREKTYAKVIKEKDIDVNLPAGILPKFSKKHRQYLENRKFDADELIVNWDLKATGHLGAYKHRILAPITLNNVLISYQGRDITGKSSMRYMACRGELEKINHKNSLYGIDEVPGQSVVVVEGITDVWRLGYGAVATFGIKYSESQVLLLSKFKRIFVLFDEYDDNAQEAAEKMVFCLGLLGNDVQKINTGLDVDPGDMSDNDALHLMRELMVR